MQIDGVKISNFGAQLIQYEVGASASNIKVEWSPKGLTPLVTEQPPKFKSLTITLFMQAETRTQLEKNKSLLCQACSTCIIKFPGDTLEYNCVTSSTPKVQKLNNLSEYLTLTLNCFTTEPYSLINLQKSLEQNVNIKGNSTVEVIYTITTTDPIGSFTIQGITISNLPESSTTIIDGEKKTIKTNGLNKFSECDIVEFPTLPNGNVSITISSVMPTVTIKYKPKWA